MCGRALALSAPCLQAKSCDRPHGVAGVLGGEGAQPTPPTVGDVSPAGAAAC